MARPIPSMEASAKSPNGWTEWIWPRHGDHKGVCCDCGLVHRYQFRIVDGHVEYRVRRDGRSTAMFRRWLKRRGFRLTLARN